MSMHCNVYCLNWKFRIKDLIKLLIICQIYRGLDFDSRVISLRIFYKVPNFFISLINVSFLDFDFFLFPLVQNLLGYDTIFWVVNLFNWF